MKLPADDTKRHEVTVASICPKAFTVKRLHYAPVGTYELKAASFEQPYTLLVRDAWMQEYDGENVGNRLKLISAEDIAADIVHECTELIPGWAPDRCLGLFVCAGAAPTKAELLEAQAKQDRFLAERVMLGDELYQQNREKEIQEMSRLAAKVLNLHERPWLREPRSGDMKKCPACAEFIKNEAVICRFCGKDVEQFLKQRGNVPALVKQSVETRV